ncbi:WD40-repeat-containing domain protein [Scleroderma citrinum]
MSEYQCDVLPAPRLAHSPSPSPPLSPEPEPEPEPEPMLAPPPQVHRKLCVRHQRMADEGTNIKLQQSLDALPVGERESISTIWSSFSSSPHPRRELILRGILTMCCFSQLSLLTEQLSHLIRIDPFTILPREISLKILIYLDATSLCRAAQVSRHWRSLADDDILWRGICEQHIGQKCLKCGWGLPILEKKRNFRLPSVSPFPSPPPPVPKRENTDDTVERPPKRHRTSGDEHLQVAGPSSLASSLALASSSSHSSQSAAITDLLCPPNPTLPHSEMFTRPWKDVYSERLTVERNWRRGRCKVHTLRGHTDGVMCLQFSETLTHPSFPILITGSYDRTIRVWNLETGVEIRCLRGHTRAVRCLQFDEAKLITGSMDHTIRVWNWRKGECIRTLRGHTDGVVCINFDANVLASGSVDSTVKVWNFSTGEAFTLRGHRDWVNSVKLWDTMEATTEPHIDSCDSSLQIQTGKMLFSASDDGTIRLWDLAKRTCVRQYTGHVGQVQSLKLLEVDEGCDEDADVRALQAVNISENHTPGFPGSSRDTVIAADVCTIVTHDGPVSPIHSSDRSISPSPGLFTAVLGTRSKKPVLISGSLDNTIKVWDIDSGKTVRTLFGHIEGVWAVAGDKLRLVSGSHDRTIKVWNLEEGKCTTTLFGHRGAVTCIALGEDKIVSGSDDGDVRIWSFSS